MATEIIHTIRAAASSPLGDYTTLTAWESAQQRDLTSSSPEEIAVAECYDDWPSGLSDTVTVAGWTTNATAYPFIRAAAGQGHGGVVDGGFVLTASSAAFTLQLSQNYSVVEDIEVRHTGAFLQGPVGVSGVTGCVVDRVIVAKSNWVASSCALSQGTSILFRSCLAIGDLSASEPDGFVLGLGASGDLNTAENCTASGCNRGFFFQGLTANHIAKNCVAWDCTVSYQGTTVDTTNSTNNASDEGSPHTIPGTNPLTGIVSGDFVDDASNDFNVSSKSSALFGAGVELDSGLNDVDDLRGAGRYSWDIGAYELDVSFDYLGLDFVGDIYDTNNQTGADITVFATDSNPTTWTGPDTVTFVNTVTLQVRVRDENGATVEGARVRIEGRGIESPQVHTAGEQISQGETNASGIYSDSTYNYTADATVQIKVRLKGYKPFRTNGNITGDGLTVGVRLDTDRIVDLP